MRVQELAARIKEAGWPGDPLRFAATLVDEITDLSHGVATGEQLANAEASFNARLTHEIAQVRDEMKLIREELRGVETRLELRLERGLRQWGLLIVAVMGVVGALLALLD